MTTISIKIEDQTYEIHTMPLPEKGDTCCKKATLVVRTPRAADFTTCPICGLGDYYNVLYSDIFGEDPFYFDDPYDECECAIYCPNCHIIYGIGECIHAYRGCTDDVHYGKLIESFEYNGILYDGMPVYKSKKEAKIIDKLLKKKYICTCKGNCAMSVCSVAYSQSEAFGPSYVGNCYACHCKYNLSHYFTPKHTQ